MKTSTLLPLLGLVAGCGDGIVTDDYRGEPLFEMRGKIVTLIMMSPVEGQRYRAAAFWIRSSTTTAPSTLVEQASVSTEILLSGDFSLVFFRPPPDDAFSEADAQLAAGLALLYRDADLDGRYTEGTDELLGGTLRHGFFYAREPIDDGPLGRSIPAGFSSATLPLLCAGQRDGDPPASDEVELIIPGSVPPEAITCL